MPFPDLRPKGSVEIKLPAFAVEKEMVILLVKQDEGIDNLSSDAVTVVSNKATEVRLKAELNDKGSRRTLYFRVDKRAKTITRL